MLTKKILICEDDEDIVELTRIILGGHGYEIFVLKMCGNDIVCKVRDIMPDLVLMDLWLPEIGGEKAIQQLKAHPDTKDIPVVVFSACNQAELIAQRLKADGCIPKPFAVDFFEEKISEIIGHAPHLSARKH